jgi:hypothetical protein
VIVDQRRRQIYWIYLDLTSSPKPFIGAADADTGMLTPHALLNQKLNLQN